MGKVVLLGLIVGFILICACDIINALKESKRRERELEEYLKRQEQSEIDEYAENVQC